MGSVDQSRDKMLHNRRKNYILFAHTSLTFLTMRLYHNIYFIKGFLIDFAAVANQNYSFAKFVQSLTAFCYASYISINSINSQMFPYI